MSKIIAISGFKRSGKDTVAKQLIDNHNFKRLAFADPLKDLASKEYNFPRDHADNPEFKEAPILHLPVIPKDDFSLNLVKFMFREFRSQDGRIPMELVEDASGTLLGLMGYTRVFGAPDATQLYWTPRALCILKASTNRTVDSNYWVQNVIKDIRATKGNYVITDLRYKNELSQLKQAFGKDLVSVRINRFDSIESTDPSENDLNDSKFDVVIENKGTLDELTSKVENLIKG